MPETQILSSLATCVNFEVNEISLNIIKEGWGTVGLFQENTLAWKETVNNENTIVCKERKSKEYYDGYVCLCLLNFLSLKYCGPQRYFHHLAHLYSGTEGKHIRAIFA